MIKVNDPNDGEGYTEDEGVRRYKTVISSDVQVASTPYDRNDFPPIIVETLNDLPRGYEVLKKHIDVV
jgi:hypothetical protein